MNLFQMGKGTFCHYSFVLMKLVIHAEAGFAQFTSFCLLCSNVATDRSWPLAIGLYSTQTVDTVESDLADCFLRVINLIFDDNFSVF